MAGILQDIFHALNKRFVPRRVVLHKIFIEAQEEKSGDRAYLERMHILWCEQEQIALTIIEPVLVNVLYARTINDIDQFKEVLVRDVFGNRSSSLVSISNGWYKFSFLISANIQN